MKGNFLNQSNRTQVFVKVLGPLPWVTIICPFLLYSVIPSCFAGSAAAIYRSRQHSCSYFGIRSFGFSGSDRQFTEVDDILAHTSVFAALASLARASGLPFLLILRYSQLWLLWLEPPVYRSRRHSCSYFGIRSFGFSGSSLQFTEVSELLPSTP